MKTKEREEFRERKNKRLNTCNPTNSEGTAAWANCDESYDVEQVSKPSIDKVIDAKDWVDNGSKL